MEARAGRAGFDLAQTSNRRRQHVSRFGSVWRPAAAARPRSLSEPGRAREDRPKLGEVLAPCASHPGCGVPVCSDFMDLTPGTDSTLGRVMWGLGGLALGSCRSLAAHRALCSGRDGWRTVPPQLPGRHGASVRQGRRHQRRQARRAEYPSGPPTRLGGSRKDGCRGFMIYDKLSSAARSIEGSRR